MYQLLSHSRTAAVLPVVAGCVLITLCSLIRIPFYPVPMTMHTFAIFVLGLTQSPRNAAASALLFLAVGTFNPFWMMGKCAGYFFAFPVAAYVIAFASRKMPALCAVLLGQCVIYVVGFLCLAPFIGAQAAFSKGVLFFIPSAIVKAILAVAVVKPFHQAKIEKNEV
jgi:biotin transport system substrate-specific component